MRVVLSLWKGLIEVPETMAAITARVAEQHGATVSELRFGRQRALSAARFEAMALCYDEVRSSQRVATYFGGRDRSTVVYARARHAARVTA